MPENTTTNVAPPTPGPWGSASEWAQWAKDYRQHVSRVLTDEAARVGREYGWCSDGQREVLARIRQAADLPAPGPRNPLYDVTVIRRRVRATSEQDAVNQVVAALRDVEFTDRSNVRRNFRHNTDVFATHGTE
jgi:hypothetical protein